MSNWIRKATIVLAAGGALLWAAGCENTHRENVKAAEGRWSRARAAVMMQLADQQYKGGQPDKALLTLGKALELDPNFPQLQVLRGQILAEKGQIQAAVSAFELAVAMDPKAADAHYYCGIQLERGGQFDKALEHYQAAHEIAPSNVSYAVACAETLGQLDRTKEGLDLLGKMLEAQEQSVALRVTAGELCAANGDFDMASHYYRDAARLATDDSGIIRSLALALYHAGRTDEARGYLEQLLNQPADDGGDKAAPEAEPTPLVITDLSTESDEPGESPAARAELLLALGDCYLAGRQSAAKARDCFNEAIRLSCGPQVATAWEFQAKAAMQQGQWVEMDAAADKVLSLAGESAPSRLLKGYALSRQGRWADALAAFQAARKLAPRDPLMLCLVSQSQEKLGDGAAARETLIRALQIAPNDPLAVRMMDEMARAEFGETGPAVNRPSEATAGVLAP